MNALPRYVESWIACDPKRISSAVTDGCVVSESWGPVYRGRAAVRRWAEVWTGAGGVVLRWDLTDHFSVDEREVATWSFEYSWQGQRDVIHGASIALVKNGLIDRLSEFRTTAPSYDWVGAWA